VRSLSSGERAVLGVGSQCSGEEAEGVEEGHFVVPASGGWEG
jgi:hypothetical protein